MMILENKEVFTLGVIVGWLNRPENKVRFEKESDIKVNDVNRLIDKIVGRHGERSD